MTAANWLDKGHSVSTRCALRAHPYKRWARRWLAPSSSDPALELVELRELTLCIRHEGNLRLNIWFCNSKIRLFSVSIFHITTLTPDEVGLRWNNLGETWYRRSRNPQNRRQKGTWKFSLNIFNQRLRKVVRYLVRWQCKDTEREWTLQPAIDGPDQLDDNTPIKWD